MASDVLVAASAVVILSALVVFIRAAFNFAVTIRDNTLATKQLTGRMDGLAARLDEQYAELAARVTRLEAR